MSIEFLKLYNASTEEERDQFAKDVHEGLSQQVKDFPEQYLYDEQGSKLFASMNHTQEYYLSDREKDIFHNQGEAILQVIGKEKFNFVDLGAGDATKTKILLEKAINQSYNVEYIPIDISQDSNKVLSGTIQEMSSKLDMTVITSKFEEGIDWVFKNKEEKNVLFMIGGTVGCFEKDVVNKSFTEIGKKLKKGDLIVLGVDIKKNPVPIQNAYFTNEFEFPFLMNSIRRMNRDLNSNFDDTKFYPHSFFNPIQGFVRGCLISKEEQDVTIDGKQYHFKEYETMKVTRSRKWLDSEIKELMELAGMKPKAVFSDSKDYFREYVFEKE